MKKQLIRNLMLMTPGLLVLNVYAIGSMFIAVPAKSQVVVKEYKLAVDGIICEVGAPYQSCKPVENKVYRAVFNGQVYELSQESGLVVIL